MGDTVGNNGEAWRRNYQTQEKHGLDIEVFENDCLIITSQSVFEDVQQDNIAVWRLSGMGNAVPGQMELNSGEIDFEIRQCSLL